MGLDSYVFRIIKPEPLNEEVVSEPELYSIGLTFVRTADLSPAMFADLVPYSLQAKVITPYLDMEEVRKVYGDLADNAGQIFHQDGSIEFLTSGSKHILITADDIHKRFTVYKEVPSLLFFSEEVAYWRKHYAVQKFFYEHIDDIENTGFYLINKEVLEQYNKLALENGWQSLPPEAPSEYSALFYHEWY